MQYAHVHQEDITRVAGHFDNLNPHCLDRSFRWVVRPKNVSQRRKCACSARPEPMRPGERERSATMGRNVVDKKEGLHAGNLVSVFCVHIHVPVQAG